MLTTNKSAYTPDEDVLLNLTVENRGLNAVLSELKVTVSVSDATTIQYTEEQTLVNLWPGSSAELTPLWNTASYAPGDYTATAEFYVGNNRAATSTTAFTIT